MMKSDPDHEGGGVGGDSGGGPGGTSLFDVIDALGWVLNPIGSVTSWVIGNAVYSHRTMTNTEWDMAKGVFGNTLPDRSRIILTDMSGLDDRPFTLPGSMILSLIVTLPPLPLGMNELRMALAALVNKIGLGTLSGGYVICMGDAYSVNSAAGRDTLIHELTHTWQGWHGGYQWQYVFSSVLAQIKSGQGAYAYTLGKSWGSYNPEQQAHIVEDWFHKGSKTTDERFPYIRDHIRKGKN